MLEDTGDHAPWEMYVELPWTRSVDFEGRLAEALSPYLEPGNGPEQLLATIEAMVERLRSQLSIWVGSGGAKAVLDRAAQMSAADCPLLLGIHVELDGVRFEWAHASQVPASVEELRDCLRVYAHSVFVVVTGLTGNVLVDRLLGAIRQ